MTIYTMLTDKNSFIVCCWPMSLRELIQRAQNHSHWRQWFCLLLIPIETCFRMPY